MCGFGLQGQLKVPGGLVPRNCKWGLSYARLLEQQYETKRMGCHRSSESWIVVEGSARQEHSQGTQCAGGHR